MTELLSPAGPGRRERKKQETRRVIKDAALALALERGLEHLTVEQITEAADVSRRTFFNYFSCKEDALITDCTEIAEQLRQMVLDRPAEETPLQAVRAALDESRLLGEENVRRDRALDRQRLVRDNPSLLPRQLGQFATIERAFAEAVTQRLGADPDQDMRPDLVAAVGVSVIRVAMRRWTERGTPGPDVLVDEAFDLLDSRV